MAVESVGRVRAKDLAMRLRLFAVGVVAAGFVSLLAYAGATGDQELGRFGMNLLVVPMVVAAFFFGVRGAAISAVVAVSAATILYLVADLFPASILVTRSLVLCLVAGIVGWSVERERATARVVEQQRRVLERRHALSLELLAATESGTFVEVNPAWERKLGYSADKLIGRDFLDFVHADDRAAVEVARRQLAAGDEITAQVSRFRHADGHYSRIEWSARHDPIDERNYIAGRDVTARHDAEQALALHNDMLEKAVAERTSDLQERTTELEQISRELDFAHREDLRRLAMVAEFRDDKTAEHTERVGIAAALIARELGLPERDIKRIREAAPLHDIGKIGTPDAILLNPRGLSDSDWTVMQQHTLLGHKLLGDSHAPVLKVAAVIALGHHEWWDGSGYPSGLRGEEIPLEARIVAVADVFDALTHDRPYKAAWALEHALQEINQLSGRQFDPQVAEAFQRIENEHLTALIEPQRSQRMHALSG